ncbi:MAG: HEAT repeat domain-containing protein [Armatimonadetes bacterium]|nr:HEAT repeat domain-containing protein [Armatimonadota bacterium]MDW8028522.1 HEAT repeat domain-containing protein [Armatimonadota bacterium]
MEQKKDLTKKSQFMPIVWKLRNWLPILLLVPSIFSGLVINASKGQVHSIDPLKQERAFEQILKMPSDKAIAQFVRALTILGSDLAHALAVEGLGLLKAKEAIPILFEALKHPSAKVRAKAIWALSEIGDPSTAPHIIPLLGDSSLVKGDQTHPVSKYAAGALAKLGERKSVKAFSEAMQGCVTEWTKQQLSEKCSPQVVQEFAKLLDSDVTASLSAAQALGELLFVEAIPDLERKAYLLSTPPKLSKVFLKVLAKLDNFSRLPAPPSALPETMNLLRPSTASEIETSKLPRAASSDSERDSRLSRPEGDEP